MYSGKPIHGEPLPIARAIHTFHRLRSEGVGVEVVKLLGLDPDDLEEFRFWAEVILRDYSTLANLWHRRSQTFLKKRVLMVHKEIRRDS